jgi:hypothetical protein
MGVMGFGQGVVGHVRVEVLAATRATMLGVEEMDIAGATGHQVANIMQDAFAGSTTETGSAAPGTRPMCEVSPAANDLGLGQIFGARDAFRGVWHILAGSSHNQALLGCVFQPRNLQDLLGRVMAKCLF